MVLICFPLMTSDTEHLLMDLMVICMEKEMVTHSSILAWKIPWTEKPGRLQSMGSQRLGHDLATSLSHSGQVEPVLISRRPNPVRKIKRS